MEETRVDLQITCLVADSIDAINTKNIHFIRYLITRVKAVLYSHKYTCGNRAVAGFLADLLNGLGGVDASYQNQKWGYDHITHVLMTWCNVLEKAGATYELGVIKTTLNTLESGAVAAGTDWESDVWIIGEGDEITAQDGEWWR